jgi:glycosyltransferase involved in cell wall biosynthesis
MNGDTAVIVGLNVAQTVSTVVAQLPSDMAVVFVDDGSTDGGGEALDERVHVIRHERNLGYGAAQKSGYQYALSAGAKRIVLVHGDDQYNVDDCLSLLSALKEADVALGSRFLMPDKGLIIPWWRRWSNRGLTGLANRRLALSLTDMHTGARAYRAESLRSLDFQSFSDDYLFDQQILVSAAKQNFRIAERPQRTRYGGSAQSIALGPSIRYGLGCVRTILKA